MAKMLGRLGLAMASAVVGVLQHPPADMTSALTDTGRVREVREAAARRDETARAGLFMWDGDKNPVHHLAICESCVLGLRLLKWLDPALIAVARALALRMCTGHPRVYLERTRTRTPLYATLQGYGSIPRPKIRGYMQPQRKYLIYHPQAPQLSPGGSP
ncbi:hypothetical protein B0H14DRAFT_2614213 [Mycena olivaceomarginata]|nr:hypothetical protein B0H14DRAFT_2614213 [Mycena olivaceomarginata]